MPRSQSMPAPSSRFAQPGLLVPVLCFTGLMSVLAQTLVVPIIPQLPQYLNTSAANASWVVTATLLAAAVSTPVTGRLGDMFGKRRVLLAVIGLMLIGTLVSAASSTIVPMVIGRTLQGIASGAIPLGISIMRDQLPARKLVPAIGIMSSTLGVGGAIGLPLSAAVVQFADWHVVFLMAGAFAVLALVLVLLVVPESPVRTPARFDLIGVVGLTVGLVALILAITKGSSWGWASAWTLVSVAVAAVVLVLWGWWELRVPSPLVNLRLAVKRDVLFTNLASVAAGFSVYAMNIVYPQILQAPREVGHGLGLSVLMVGFCMAPSGLVMMIASPLSARLSYRFGARSTLLVGLAVIAVGYLISLLLMSAAWQFVVASSVIGVGLAFAYSAMPALIMDATPASETGAANGLNALMRSLGTCSSSAVMSAVLAATTVSIVLGAGSPEGSRAVTVPTLGAFQLALAIAAFAALLGLVVGLRIPKRPAGHERVVASMIATDPLPSPAAMPSISPNA